MRRPRFSWRQAAALTLVVLAVLPILIAGLDALLRTWYPAGDWGILELRTLDVGTAHTPLVGPYSRYSWNHPGPLIFWLYAIPYRLSGGSPSALLFAASLINAGSVAGMLGFAWRRGRLALVVPMAVALSLLVHTLGPAMVRDPWNAWVTVLPFGLLLVAAWAAIEGDRLALPTVAVVGSFLAQSHIGFAPFVAVFTLVAAVGLYLRVRDPRRLLAGGIALVLCWLPVLFDVLTGGSNVSKILAHFTGSGNNPAGLHTALGVTALELNWDAPFLGAGEPVNAAGGGLDPGSYRGMIVPLLVFAVAMVVAWRVRAKAAFRLQAIVVLATLVGIVSVSRITGDVFDYLVRWWWLIAALGVASAGWSLWCGFRTWTAGWTPTRATRLAMAGTALAALLVLSLTIGTSGKASSAALPADDWFPALDHVAPALTQIPNDKPVLIQVDGPISGWVGDAMAARFTAEGYRVFVTEGGINEYKFGDFRISKSDGSDERGVWMVTGSRIDDFRAEGRAKEIAAYDPLTPQERATSNALEKKLRATYVAAHRQELVDGIDNGVSLYADPPVPGLDQADVDAYEKFRQRGVPLAMFVYDQGNAHPPARAT